MMMHQPLEGTPIAADAAEWDAAMARYLASDHRAKREWDAFCACSHDHPDRKLLASLCEESGQAEADALEALLKMPAPHLAALRWKLGHVITFHEAEEPDEFMDSWARRRVQQTISDYLRLLPDVEAG